MYSTRGQQLHYTIVRISKDLAAADSLGAVMSSTTRFVYWLQLALAGLVCPFLSLGQAVRQVGVTTVVLAGDPVPGPVGGTLLMFQSSSGLGRDESVVYCVIVAPDDGSDRIRTLWRTRDGETQPFASTESGITGVSGEFVSFPRKIVNSTGDFALTAEYRPKGMSQTDVGIWQSVDDKLELVAVEDGLAPGTQGRRFRYFDFPLINDLNQIAFLGELDDGPASQRRGLW